MQLSKETIQFISNVIKVARILKVEHVLLDHECVRGHFQEEGSMIIHRDNLPNFEFSTLGISRIETLNARLNLLGDDVVIDTEEKVESPTSSTVSKLIMSNAKTEVEFQCANPALLAKAPRILKDPIFFTFDISPDSILLLSKAQGAVKGETVSLVGSPKGVIAKISDVEGDMLNHIITDKLTTSSEADKDKFYFSYKHRVLLSLLKEASDKEDITVNVTRRGILNLKVLGINVYITPEL